MILAKVENVRITPGKLIIELSVPQQYAVNLVNAVSGAFEIGLVDAEAVRQAVAVQQSPQQVELPNISPPMPKAVTGSPFARG